MSFPVVRLTMEVWTNLLVRGSFFLLGHSLIDIKHSWDVELHAVQVSADHRPQLIQAWVTGLCNLVERVQKRYITGVEIINHNLVLDKELPEKE